MLLPVVALAAVDYYLTVQVYGYGFAVSDYLVTWSWYAAAMVLGRILLSNTVNVPRVAAAAILGPTSFFLVSNYAVWAGAQHAGGMYPAGFSGLLSCLVAGLPFYGRDLISTGLVLTLAFGIPVVRRLMNDQDHAIGHSRL